MSAAAEAGNAQSEDGMTRKVSMAAALAAALGIIAIAGVVAFKGNDVPERPWQDCYGDNNNVACFFNEISAFEGANISKVGCSVQHHADKMTAFCSDDSREVTVKPTTVVADEAKKLVQVVLATYLAAANPSGMAAMAGAGSVAPPTDGRRDRHTSHLHTPTGDIKKFAGSFYGLVEKLDCQMPSGATTPADFENACWILRNSSLGLLASLKGAVPVAVPVAAPVADQGAEEGEKRTSHEGEEDAPHAEVPVEVPVAPVAPVAEVPVAPVAEVPVAPVAPVAEVPVAPVAPVAEVPVAPVAEVPVVPANTTAPNDNTTAPVVEVPTAPTAEPVPAFDGKVPGSLTVEDFLKVAGPALNTLLDLAAANYVTAYSTIWREWTDAGGLLHGKSDVDVVIYGAANARRAALATQFYVGVLGVCGNGATFPGESERIVYVEHREACTDQPKCGWSALGLNQVDTNVATAFFGGASAASTDILAQGAAKALQPQLNKYATC